MSREEIKFPTPDESKLKFSSSLNKVTPHEIVEYLNVSASKYYILSDDKVSYTGRSNSKNRLAPTVGASKDRSVGGNIPN